MIENSENVSETTFENTDTTETAVTDTVDEIVPDNTEKKNQPKLRRGRPRKNPSGYLSRPKKITVVKTADEVGIDSLNVLLRCAMLTGSVKFSYKSKRNRIINTTGTLHTAKIPDREIAGDRVPKDNNMCVFYDVRHGIYRQFPQDGLISVQVKEVVK